MGKIEADTPLRLRLVGGPGFHFPPFSKSIQSVIVGVVSGDGGRRRMWGEASEKAGIVRVGLGVIRVGGFVGEMGGILSKKA